MSVYLSVCLSGNTRAVFTKFLVHVDYGRGSIFLRRRGRSLLSTIALFQIWSLSPLIMKI